MTGSCANGEAGPEGDEACLRAIGSHAEERPPARPVGRASAKDGASTAHDWIFCCPVDLWIKVRIKSGAFTLSRKSLFFREK
jgi:hypothetical protein